MIRSRSLLRGRGSHDSGKVGMVELFFDLVFVFAVTQLSHALLAHLSLAGVLQVALLMVAVWWVWIFTSWITNWLDPQTLPIRLGLFVLMVAGLLLSSSIPKAFGDRGLLFAAAYVFMQVGRTAYSLWAVRGEPLNMTRNFQRILLWLMFSGCSGSLAACSRARDAWPAGPWPWASRSWRHRCISGYRGLAARPWRTGISKATTWPSVARCS